MTLVQFLHSMPFHFKWYFARLYLDYFLNELFSTNSSSVLSKWIQQLTNQSAIIMECVQTRSKNINTHFIIALQYGTTWYRWRCKFIVVLKSMRFNQNLFQLTIINKMSMKKKKKKKKSPATRKQNIFEF